MENNNSIITAALSEADEAGLIMEAQAGNERAMERLIEAYTPAIERTARKHEHDGEYEDAKQEAIFAFIKIVQEHDFDKAKRLNYYVHARMDNHMTVALSESSNSWGIPGRTLRRFYQVYEKADGDLTLGAQIAPDYDLASLTFITIADMLHVGSLDAARETDDGSASVLDTFDGPMFGGGEVTDAYDAVIDRMTVEQMMADSMGDEHDRMVRMSYGFEGPLTVGEDVIDMTDSSRDLKAHSGADVAAALTWEGFKGKNWTRPTVNRRVNEQITVWREKYAESNISTGKDN